MKACRFLPIGLFALALTSAAAHAASAEAKREDAKTTVERNEEKSPKGKRYSFEHELLPRATHGTQGGFFDEVQTGSTEKLRAAARKLVGDEFAEAVTVRVVPGASAVLISFPTPLGVPECFHALVIKAGEKYRYVTLERNSVLYGGDIKSMIGEWTEDGSHKTLGGRTYTDSEAFIAEVLGKTR